METIDVTKYASGFDTSAFKNYLIERCFRSFDLFATVHSRVDEIQFFSEHEDAEQHAVWTILTQYYQQFHVLPALDTFNSLLHTYQSIQLELYDECDWQIESVRYHAKQWAQKEELPDDEVAYCQAQVDAYYQNQLQNQLRTAIDSQIDSEQLRALLQETETALSATTQGIQKEVNPFRGDPDIYLHEEPRIPCGVPILDKITGGGPRPGEMIGFIMPSGGGKTTIAVQVDEACVKQGCHVAHQTFEQSLHGDITTRMIIRMLDIRRKDWEGNSLRELLDGNPQLQAMYNTCLPAWQEYLHVYEDGADPDFRIHSVADLFTPIEKMYDEKGIKTRFLLLDWWRPIIMKLKQTAPAYARKSESAMRDYVAECGIAIKQHTQRLVRKGIPLTVVMFNQVRGGSVLNNKNGSKKETSHAAQEDSNWNNFLDFCVASTKPDQRNQMINFNCDKARGNIAANYNQVLDGQRCLIIDPSDELLEQAAKEQRQSARR